jgi:succinoglycan biosynthesis protein ExoA
MRELMPTDRDGAGEASVDCSVLVPVLNEEADIAATMRAMLAQEFPGELEFLVVDGGSSDRTREIVDALAVEDPRIRLLDNPRRTTPSGLNVAVANARGRWVARMDGHTAYPARYVALGVERLSRGRTRWVSGPTIPVGRGAVSRAVALALRTPLGRGGSRKWASERSEDHEYQLDAGVFAGVWERSTVLEYGGWDERWLRNQDSEMAGRFQARGEHLICLPGMAAHYLPRDSLLSLWRQYLQYGAFREMTAVRHPDTMRRSHLLPPALVATVAAAVGAPSAPVRKLARGALALYAAVLATGGVHAARSAEARRDAGLVPVVLAVMHLAHGTGAWIGAARHGAPLAGIATVLRLRRLAERLAPGAAEVYAPSLREAVTPPLTLVPSGSVDPLDAHRPREAPVDASTGLARGASPSPRAA